MKIKKINPGATGKDYHRERNHIMGPSGFLTSWGHWAQLLEAQSLLLLLTSQIQMQNHAPHWRQCRFSRENRGAQALTKMWTSFWRVMGMRTGPFIVAETWRNPNCQAQPKIRTSEITFQVQREGVFRNCHTQLDPTLLGRLCFNFRVMPLHPTDIFMPDEILKKTLHLYRL